MQQPLLAVQNLRTQVIKRSGATTLVDGVSFAINPGETVGLVGESGCGKSVTSLSILRLLAPQFKLSGEIRFDGQDLLALSPGAIRSVRGSQISMIFQEPMTSLNPVYTVGAQIVEAIRIHEDVTRRQAEDRAVEMLRRVGIPSPDVRAGQYPHQLSGGMRQRVMIAMALALNPRLLIADEPTTALDVTIQAQILNLMKRLSAEQGTAILLITHDLGVVADMCQRVLVMYAGRLVEEASVDDLFHRPLHPYTEGLIRSLPRLEGERERLHVITGAVPAPGSMPTGCRFHPRCPYATDACLQGDPPLMETGDGRKVACWRHAEIETQGVA